MEKEEEFIWNDDDIIKPRCLKCFILFPKIIKPKFSNDFFELNCDYCRYKQILNLTEYLKFIKSNNIQIPLCSQCNQNMSNYIDIWKYKYICNNCLNQNGINNYRILKNNFNSYYCKKHNKSFAFINQGEPYCKICYSNIDIHINCGPLMHSYPIVYNKVKNNLENLKKDKLYIDNLISEIKIKYPVSEEKICKKMDENDEDDDYNFSNFNEYYNKEFLVNINSLIEFIEILLKNYNPKKLNENLSLTLEVFIYYKKIKDFNFIEFEKSELKWLYLTDYLEEYFNPFIIKSSEIKDNNIFQNKLKFEKFENEKLYFYTILKDGRILGKIDNNIVIFDIEKSVNNKIKFDILYKLEEYVIEGIIELENGNLFINNKIYKIENNTLIIINEINPKIIDEVKTRDIMNLTKNRIGINNRSWSHSFVIYDGNTFKEIKTLATKDYSLSCCQLLNKEILALSISHECLIEFWSLEN